MTAYNRDLPKNINGVNPVCAMAVKGEPSNEVLQAWRCLARTWENPLHAGCTMTVISELDNVTSFSKPIQFGRGMMPDSRNNPSSVNVYLAIHT